MLLRKVFSITIVCAFYLWSSNVSAQSLASTQGSVPDEVILTLSSNRASQRDPATFQKQLKESLRVLTPRGKKIRFLHPEFCSLARTSGSTPQVQHLKMLSHALENSAIVSDTRLQSLKNYVAHEYPAEFCSQVIIGADGKDPAVYSLALKGKRLKHGFTIAEAQPNYRYKIDRSLIAELAHNRERPTGVISVITSPSLSKEFAGLRFANAAELVGNRRDDDRNGYVDDIFGIGRNNAGAPKELASDAKGGYITLEVASDQGSSIEYSSEKAAQAMLYALHRGSSRVLLPFDLHDKVLLQLNSRTNIAGTSVDMNPAVTSAAIKTSAATGATAILQGYATLSTGKLYGQAIAMFDDNTYQATSLDTFLTGSPTKAIYYFAQLPQGKRFRLMISVEGALFTVNGQSEVSLTLSKAENPLINFTGSYLPNQRQTITLKSVDAANKPYPGTTETIYNTSVQNNLFPGEPILWDAYTDLTGTANINLRVGSFFTLYAPRQSDGSTRPPVYGVANKNLTYTWRQNNTLTGAHVCFTLVDSAGKPIKDKAVGLEINGVFRSWVPTGWDGKNCFADYPVGSNYRVYYTNGTGEVTGKLTQSVAVVITGMTKVATPTPTRGTATATPTPKKTVAATPTPTRAATSVPTNTPTPTPTPTQSVVDQIYTTVIGTVKEMKGGALPVTSKVVRYWLGSNPSRNYALALVSSSGTFTGTIVSAYGDTAHLTLAITGCTVKPVEIVKRLTGQAVVSVDFVADCSTGEATPTPTPTKITGTPTPTPTPPVESVKLITGRLLKADGSPAVSVPVTARSVNTSGAVTYVATTNAQGTYYFQNISITPKDTYYQITIPTSNYRFEITGLQVDVRTPGVTVLPTIKAY